MAKATRERALHSTKPERPVKRLSDLQESFFRAPEATDAPASPPSAPLR